MDGSEKMMYLIILKSFLGSGTGHRPDGEKFGKPEHSAGRALSNKISHLKIGSVELQTRGNTYYI